MSSSSAKEKKRKEEPLADKVKGKSKGNGKGKNKQADDAAHRRASRHENVSRMWHYVEQQTYVPSPTHDDVRPDRSENTFIVPLHASFDKEATEKSALLKNDTESSWQNAVPNRDWERGAVKIWRMHVFCAIVYALMFCTLVFITDISGFAKRSMPFEVTMSNAIMHRGKYEYSEPKKIMSFDVMFFFKMATFLGGFTHFLSVRPFGNRFLRVTYQAGIQTGRDIYRFTHFVFSWPSAVLAFAYMCGIHDVFNLSALMFSCFGIGYSFFYIADHSRRNWITFMNKCASPRMHVKFTKRGAVHFPRENSAGEDRTVEGKLVQTESGLLETSTYHINVFTRVLAAGMRLYGVHPFVLFPGVFATKDHIDSEDIYNYWQKMMVPYVSSLIDASTHYVSGFACLFIYCMLIWGSFIFNQMDLDVWLVHYENLQPLCTWVAFFAVFFVPVLCFFFAAGYNSDSHRSKAMFTVHTATIIHNLLFCLGHWCVFYAVMRYCTENADISSPLTRATAESEVVVDDVLKAAVDTTSEYLFGADVIV